MRDAKKVNANLVDALGSALRSGDHGLKAVPGLVKRVLKEEAWRSFVTQRGEQVEYDRFEDFVVTPPLKGLGASVTLVRTLITRDAEALDLFDRVTQNPNGGDRRSEDFSVSNTHTERPATGTRANALRRLRKDRPDLHAEVLADRLSAHAAMVRAGFRRQTISVPIGQPDSVAATLRKHMSLEDLARLIELLKETP